MAVTAFTMGSGTWSSFWAFQPATPASASQNAVTYTQLGVKAPVEQGISRVFARGGMRATRRIMNALLGAAVGGTATETFAQIDAPTALSNSAALGGNRTVNTVTAVNRATTAADLTYMQGVLSRMLNAPAIASYPVDLSGNGGGGKAGR